MEWCVKGRFQGSVASTSLLRPFCLPFCPGNARLCQLCVERYLLWIIRVNKI